MYKYLIVFLSSIFTSCSLVSSIKISKAITEGHIKQTSFNREIPFKQINGFIILTVSIEGQQYDFLVDTGAPTVIDSDLAKKLKIKKLGNQKVSDAYNKKKSLAYVKIKEISIAELRFFETVAIVSDFSLITKGLCLKVSGILGANLMSRAIWQIDFAQSKINVADNRESLFIPEKSWNVDFRLYGGVGTPKFNLTVNNILHEVILDTGSKWGITLLHTAKNQLLNPQEFVLGYGTVSGFLGNIVDTIRLAKIPLVKVGDSLEVKDEIVTFRDKIISDLVGNDFLKNYLVTIDWKNQSITFSLLNISSIKSFNSFGFKPTLSNNRLIIGFLYQESPAYKIGLRLNDTILKINEWDFREVDQSKYCDFIDSKLLENAENLSVLVSSEGKERTLQLIKTDLFSQ